MKKTDAIIVAEKSDSAAAMGAPQGCKALIEIDGEPSINRVIRNLRNCPDVSRILIVAAEPVLEIAPEVDVEVQIEGSIADGVISAVRAAADSQRCLILTGDLCAAMPDSLSDLLEFAPDVDVVYPVTNKSDMVEVFPDRKAMYVKAKEGEFTGSSLLLFDPKAALSKESMIVKMLEARHNPQALLSLVGPWLAMKFMFSTLSIHEFEEHLAKALEVRCQVFVSHYPEMFLSIESTQDIELVEKAIRGM